VNKPALADVWAQAWPAALAAWSPYTRLKAPLLLETSEAAAKEGLSGSFAMIRLVDQTVVIDLQGVRELGIEDYAVEVLAHEIGHHVLAPASITDHTRTLARMLPALPTVSQHAPMIANLYTDLLINDRLARSAGLRMPELMEAVMRGNQRGKPSRLWTLYLRIYELLWGMERGSLCGPVLAPPRASRSVTIKKQQAVAAAGAGGDALTARLRQDVDAAAALEDDARLAARLIRHHARNWLEGGARFAVLVLPYLLEDAQAPERLQTLMDTKDAGQGGQPEGLTGMEPEELAEVHHPALDGDLDVDADQRAELEKARTLAESHGKSSEGQARDPYRYGELLRLAGLKLDPQTAAIRYYTERARPYLVPFPSLPASHSEDPLPEGLDPWEAGDPMEQIDWRESLILSPVPIPGLTTVQRRFGTQPGFEQARRPLDLDLYVDSSGSMPDPRSQLSWPALAGAVICLSALRAGASVQVTLWASRTEVTSTAGFVRSAEDCLRVLTSYYGGGTQFPLPTLRETHAKRVSLKRPTHILVVSDDGASTMFDTPDERGTAGIEVCAKALLQAAGGGTLALNIPTNWDQGGSKNDWRGGSYVWLRRARTEQGWLISPVATLADLLDFARGFTRRHYAATRET
jgi:hypothetical protein